MTTLGPFQKFGPGVVKETIVSKLKRNKVYSLKARVNLHTESATSYKHYFSKSNVAMHNILYSTGKRKDLCTLRFSGIESLS